MKNHQEQIITIIREMMAKNDLVIAADIAHEVKNQLGVVVSEKAINTLRRKIGLGSKEMVFKKVVEKIREQFGEEGVRKVFELYDSKGQKK